MDSTADSPGDTAPPDVCEGQLYIAIDVQVWKACGIQEGGCIKCWNSAIQEVVPFDVQPYKQVDIYKFPMWREGFDDWNLESFVCALSSEGEMLCTEGLDIRGENTTPIPEGPFEKISAGSFHVCGLKGDGTILCGGYDKTGETVVPEGKYIDLVALYLRTCALTEAGELVCWGAGSYWDDVGDLVLEHGPFVALEGEYNEVCGIRADGFVECTSNWVAEEETIPPDVPLQSVSLGYYGSLMWGTGLDAQGFAHPWPDDANYNPVPLDVAFRQYAQGDLDGCGITLTGETHCYGDIPDPPP